MLVFIEISVMGEERMKKIRTEGGENKNEGNVKEERKILYIHVHINI